MENRLVRGSPGNILPDYSVTMIQESSTVAEIAHKMAENDHNSYFQIVRCEVMALKHPSIINSYLGCKPSYVTQTFWNYFVFDVCVVMFISISLRAPRLMNSTQRCVRIG